MDYQKILERLWLDYSEMNPGVNRIHHLLERKEETIINDHIAFRTYDIENINIEVLAQVFKTAGYVEKGTYEFKEKKLNAKHYEHSTDDLAPKIFISELRTSEFSNYLQRVTREVASAIKDKGITAKELVFSNNSWGPVSYEVYKKLRNESEYAAWMYVYGFRANHFTVFVNYLKSIGSIEELNKTLKNNDFKLNTSGGEIKGSEQTMLKQSSTLADKVKVKFIEGIQEIPCCYYEFAQRFNDSNGKLFNGFIAKSADKIFESTDLQK